MSHLCLSGHMLCLWLLSLSKHDAFRELVLPADFNPFSFSLEQFGDFIFTIFFILGSGTSPREGNGNPLQYSCPENPMDRGAWRAMGHGAAKSQTRLSDFTFTLTLSPRGGGTERSALRVTFILSVCMCAQSLQSCLTL